MRARARHVFTVSAAMVAVTVVPVAPSFATETAPPETVFATVDDLAPVADPADAAVVDALEDVDEPAEIQTARTVADVPFSLVGFVLPDGVETAVVRTRSAEDGTWSDPLEVEVEEPGVDGPDLGSAEAAEARDQVTEPLWVDRADAFEVTIDGDVREVEASLIDTLGQSERFLARAARMLTPRPVTPAAEASGGPAIVSRAQWGADESWRRRNPSYASNVRYGVLHHTAGNNTYTRANAPAVVRGIYHYHARTLGWGDVGYNLLVDRFGTVYEGRAGGVDRGVIGAHAAGFNTGSFGVGVMGNHDVVDISSAALESVAQVFAWKYRVHGIDATPGRRIVANNRTIDVLAGHRDVGSTACPGRFLYARMPALRTRVASLVDSVGPATRFTDVAANYVHYDAIEALAAAQITQGCGPRRYCPLDVVTRGQMASFLQRALKLPAASGQPFRDVSGTHAAAIAALSRSGITQGCSRDRFCPDQAVTRGQMATMLQRGLKLPGGNATFRDVSNHPHQAGISAITRAGITSGYTDGTFRPNRSITRAEMAAFLHRAPLP
jgi:hypothetical protein